MAANDWMALGAIEALAARGLSVPEDVSVVGFDDVDEARFATPPLTTVRQLPRQLGVEAARAVLARAAGEAGGGDLVLQTLPPDPSVVRMLSRGPARGASRPRRAARA